MKRGDKKGFTIIEVSLVLAIAGLIFLMIFIALPALRRTQRDTARRDDMMGFIKKIKEYQTNNRGALPQHSGNSEVVNWTNVNNKAATTWGGFFRDYMGEGFVDPDGDHYNMTATKCGAKENEDCSATSYNQDLLGKLKDARFPNGYRIIVVEKAACSGEKAVGSSNPRRVAVLYRLEGAGIYCGNT